MAAVEYSIHPISVNPRESLEEWRHPRIRVAAVDDGTPIKCGHHDEKLMEDSMLEKITLLMVKLAEKHDGDYKVVTPLLRCLGNICSGDDRYCQRAVSNDKLLGALGVFLKSEHRPVKKETLWAVSNMAADKESSSLILGTDLVESIIAVCHHALDMKKEIVFCVCNLANHGAEFTRELLKRGALKSVIPFLSVSDEEVLHVTLLFVELMLRFCGTDARRVFERSDGVGHLEAYEYHQNETIRSLAHELLDTYFMEPIVEVGLDLTTKEQGAGDYPPWRQAAQN